MAILTDLTVSNDGFIDVAAGTALQQTTTTIQTFTATPGGGTWTVPTGVTSVEVLVVAGGGGGGGDGGGAGAGGIVYHPRFAVTPGAAVTVTVGAGGNGVTWAGSGAVGANSVFGTLTAIGGGGGVHSGNGQSGGSGGGGGYSGASMTRSSGGASTQTSPTGGVGYGNTGGQGGGYNADGYPGGGGGGAGSVGLNGNQYGQSNSAQNAGDGGIGIVNPISGSTTGELFLGKYWLGGGGGGNHRGTSTRRALGGRGGGGAAANSSTENGVDGTANTGGGGGAQQGSNASYRGGNGGSGVVIVKYETPVIVEQFTNPGTYTWTCPAGVGAVEVLAVGGGGGGSADWGNGGGMGGGGAGGVIYNASYSVTAGTSYTVVVGAGGRGGSGATQSGYTGGVDVNTSFGRQGTNSQFHTFIASGGGGGGGSGATTGTTTGGSGGGGGYTGTKLGGVVNQSSYSGWTVYGFAGGDHSTQPSDPGYYAGGGGGGAGGAGQKGQSGPVGGAGGSGISNSISGTATVYAAGGGGGTYSSGTGGTGGSSGVGGAGGAGASNPGGRGGDGRRNTGSGGGAGGGPGASLSIGGDGGSGGDGVVILKYTRTTNGTVNIGSPAGSTRFNTTTGVAEFYINGAYRSNYDQIADGSSPDRAAVSAAMIKAVTGTTRSGPYWIRWNGTDPKLIWCEMAMNGGGWMMILNYVHKGGASPALLTRTTSFPQMNHEYDLGPDESASTDTFGSWGHISNALAAQHPWTQYMFYGKTSGHARVIHFYGENTNIVSYIKTGTGSMNPFYADRETNWNINTVARQGTTQNYGAYSEKTPAGAPGLYAGAASIPWGVNADRSGYSNQGDSAMTEFPIYGNSTFGNPRAHWGIRGSGTRWEVDDSPGGDANNTIHRIWVR